MIRDLVRGARTSCFSFSMSLSTRCEPMKPAPPVTRIRRLAWIKHQFGTNNQDPDHANRPKPRGEWDRDPSVEIVLSPGRTWRSGGARGWAAGGWRCARRCCHWSPSAPSRGAPGPTRSKPNHTSEKSHTGTRRGQTIARLQATKRKEGEGARRSPSSWLWGLGSACLARTRGTGGLNRIRLGRTRRRCLQIWVVFIGPALHTPEQRCRCSQARLKSQSVRALLSCTTTPHHTTTDCCYQPG